MRPQIGGDWLNQNLQRLADFRDLRQPGWTRRSFTPEYAEARRWIRSLMDTAGMTTGIDIGGNLFGHRAGEQDDLLLTGSHTDTVPGAGRFDGMLGVLAGIAVVQAVQEAGRRLKHSLRIYDFLAEEPSVYGVSTVGSRAVSGHLSREMLEMRGPDGDTLEDGIQRMGGAPSKLKGPIPMPPVAAIVELHIEQGPMLETHHTQIGIVTGIVGIRRYEVRVTGSPGHAGTTPMDMRRDALVAASRLIAAVHDWGRALSGKVVVTAGHISVSPNAINVIPGSVALGIEARALDSTHMDQFEAYLSEEVQRVERSYSCEIMSKLVTREEPVLMDATMQKSIAALCDRQGLSWESLASWAGHDTVQMAHVTPRRAMIFVPSHLGLSHCPEEWTEPEDVVRGAQVLLDVIQQLDNEL